jgi:hypothetical protein
MLGTLYGGLIRVILAIVQADKLYLSFSSHKKSHSLGVTLRNDPFTTNFMVCSQNSPSFI